MAAASFGGRCRRQMGYCPARRPIFAENYSGAHGLRAGVATPFRTVYFGEQLGRFFDCGSLLRATSCRRGTSSASKPVLEGCRTTPKTGSKTTSLKPPRLAISWVAVVGWFLFVTLYRLSVVSMSNGNCSIPSYTPTPTDLLRKAPDEVPTWPRPFVRRATTVLGRRGSGRANHPGPQNGH